MRNIDRCLEIYGKKEGDFLMGSLFSMAEVFAAPMLHRSQVWFKENRGIDLRQLAVDLGLTRFTKWMDAVLARPSVTKTSIITPGGLKKAHPDWALGEEKVLYSVSNGEIVFQ